jgi:hypothetical protein
MNARVDDPSRAQCKALGSLGTNLDNIRTLLHDINPAFAKKV